MIPFRKILFPVDYSESCRTAIPWVRAAVEHFSAELTLVRAYGPLAIGYIEPPVSMPDLSLQIREYEGRHLSDFVEKHFADLEPQAVLELGDPGSVILDTVKSRGTDLVMLPTHGGGAIRRLLLGSVTTKVLHDISAAVWTAAPAALAKPNVPYRSVLAAVDTGEETAAVMVAANAFAKSYGAKLTIAHVVDLPRTTFEVDFGPYLKDVSDAAQFRLRETKAELGIDAPHVVLDGNVADGVRKAASDAGADLIVVGRGHASGGLGRIWSHLYGIVREAPCPVLSI